MIYAHKPTLYRGGLYPFIKNHKMTLTVKEKQFIIEIEIEIEIKNKRRLHHEQKGLFFAYHHRRSGADAF